MITLNYRSQIPRKNTENTTCVTSSVARARISLLVIASSDQKILIELSLACDGVISENVLGKHCQINILYTSIFSAHVSLETFCNVRDSVPAWQRSKHETKKMEVYLRVIFTFSKPQVLFWEHLSMTQSYRKWQLWFPHLKNTSVSPQGTMCLLEASYL